MKNKQQKGQVVDADPMYDDRETVTDAEAKMEQEQVAEDEADNMTADIPAADDKTAQVAEACREWQDKYLRLSAEFDNFRKRTLREKMDLIASGGEEVIKSLLGVMDDIDRAVVAVGQASDIDSMKQGVDLIHQKMLDMLRAKGVEEIEAIGSELDTDLHEAVAKLPVEVEKKGKIIDVVQKGYKLKDKVVRYAKVVVGE